MPFLRAQRICSYSEYYADGECSSCPIGSYGVRANDDTCYKCANEFSNRKAKATPEEISRYGFLCNRRLGTFAPVQSGAALFIQNKFSLQEHYREKMTLNEIIDEVPVEEPKKKLNLTQKITIGTLSTCAILIAIVISVIHCIMVKLKKRVWFLGYRPPVLRQ